MSEGPELRSWTWRQAFSLSDLHPTTKHVLHTLNLFMNAVGESCFPSIADLVKYSGRDKKTVMKHLAVARDAGWITVSQHGFRGQRWKHNEYTARWPERDLTAPCPPDEPDEGGGTAPPPCGSKVVEEIPEGGGIGSSKVVEEFHQDKNTPRNTPKNTPVERGACERDAGAREGPAVDAKAVERAFWRTVKGWPGFDGMPKENALSEWRKLSDDDRKAAEDALPRWLALLKKQHKSHVPAPSTYFKQKLWQDVPSEPAERGAATAPAFGPKWSARRFVLLLAGPTRTGIPLTAFDKRWIEQDPTRREAVLLAKQASGGFPVVDAMHDGARHGRAVAVDPLSEALAGLMVAVPVKSEAWGWWRDEHERRGWPWLPDPGRQSVVYFPGDLEEFEREAAAMQAANQAAE